MEKMSAEDESGSGRPGQNPLIGVGFELPGPALEVGAPMTSRNDSCRSVGRREFGEGDDGGGHARWRIVDFWQPIRMKFLSTESRLWTSVLGLFELWFDADDLMNDRQQWGLRHEVANLRKSYGEVSQMPRSRHGLVASVSLSRWTFGK